MSQGWQSDKAEADRFLPEAERVIRLKQPDLAFVRIAPDHQDQNEALDLIVDAQRWAWRHRRPDCRFRDLTIRYKRRLNETEWAKIQKGYGDYYLYSFTTDTSWTEERFSEWFIVDMNLLRTLRDELVELADIRYNPDGSSSFLAWSIELLRDRGCVVAEKMAQPSLFT